VEPTKAAAAIREEHLDGWLFFNLRHRDAISDAILQVSKRALNTRPWIYLIRSGGEAVKLVHAIEAEILDHLPGEKRMYASRAQLVEALKDLSRLCKRTAAQFSQDLPILSFLDHGTAELLSSCGFELRSSAGLIQRFLGLLDEGQMESHENASRKLYRIVEEVWSRIGEELQRGKGLSEGEVQGWMLSLFRREGLCSDSPPLVAAGRNSANPHYQPAGKGAPLKGGEVLQLDLWAKQESPSAVFGDISWVGVLAAEAAPEVEAAFAAVVAARQLALRFIGESLDKGGSLTGAEVDRKVRSFLEEAGYGEGLKHRTGHGIDTQAHGFGVNLDSVEFPDNRLLLEGSCFSIEPGVYLAEFGVRTEINVILRGGKAIVSGATPQSTLLLLDR